MIFIESFNYLSQVNNIWVSRSNFPKIHCQMHSNMSGSINSIYIQILAHSTKSKVKISSTLAFVWLRYSGLNRNYPINIYILNNNYLILKT